MGEAEQLLRKILEQGELAGQDATGRLVIQLAVDRATFNRLRAFGAGAGWLHGGDDEPFTIPPVALCWLEQPEFRGRPKPDPPEPDLLRYRVGLLSRR